MVKKYTKRTSRFIAQHNERRWCGSCFSNMVNTAETLFQKVLAADLKYKLVELE